MSSLQGRVAGKGALVTGAASGIGAATSHLLAREGALVAVTDINGDGANRTAQEINRDYPGQARAFTHDVTSQSDWQAVLAEASDWANGLSILVNNAGIGRFGTIEDETLEGWQQVQSVNSDSVFLGCKLAMPYLRRAAPSSIVNISSSAAYVGRPNIAAYNASKAAVWMLTKSVALHCAKRGDDIRCNSVHPGYIRTPILDPILESSPDPAIVERNIKREIPMGRLADPQDVAYAVLYLASDESRYVTGAELKVDGGMTAF